MHDHLLPGPVRRALRLVMPRTSRQLHAYIRSVLGFTSPRKSVVAGNNAPFDYIEHAFFEEMNPDRRDCIVWANRGGGKTQLGAIATLLDLLFKPGIQVRILGGSFDQSSKMHRYLKSMLEDEAFFDLIDGNLTGRAVQLINGSRVEVLSQSERAVRGQRVHRLRCDEVELFEPDVWEAAQLVTRSGTCGEVFVRASIETLSTMHRPFGMMQRLVRDAAASGRMIFHWNVLDTLEKCPASRACETCKLWEDCQGRAKHAGGFIDIDDAIRQHERIGRGTWQAEMLCEQPSRSDTVYPAFDLKVHVEGFEPPPGATWIGGIDFGYRAPTVLLWAYVDQEDVLHVVDEFHERLHTTDKIIEIASSRKWPRLEWIGADPAGHQRSEQTGVSTISLWKRAGFAIKARQAGIEPGVMAVRARLRRADNSIALKIHPRCRHLIEAMSMYHYPLLQPDSFTPVKDGHDHATDALRYLVVNLDRRGWEVKGKDY
ncbi:MAG: hypothetical protein IH891_06175 [Planctomycetes bacterium]|nr:hypothetical protein [Planctomycetota bacterium]